MTNECNGIASVDDNTRAQEHAGILNDPAPERGVESQEQSR